MIIAKFVLATPWLIYLGVKDYRTRKLPNAATLGGAAVMSAIALGVGTDYFLASIITGCLCALFLLLPFFLRAAGAGDVKMLFASGRPRKHSQLDSANIVRGADSRAGNARFQGGRPRAPKTLRKVFVRLPV